jgi:hypothetical protein
MHPLDFLYTQQLKRPASFLHIQLQTSGNNKGIQISQKLKD